MGKTLCRHTSQECVAFLEEPLLDQPRNQEIHIICNHEGLRREQPHSNQEANEQSHGNKERAEFFT